MIEATSNHRPAGIERLLFCLVLALFIGHELDAVWRNEWRMLPGFWLLPEREAQIAFVLAHVPLLTGVFWLTSHPHDRLRFIGQLTIDLLLAVHAAVHYALSGHPLYEFQPPVEWVTVYGAGLAGLLHAVLLTQKGRPR